jgi:hypothetical protein
MRWLERATMVTLGGVLAEAGHYAGTLTKEKSDGNKLTGAMGL